MSGLPESATQAHHGRSTAQRLADNIASLGAAELVARGVAFLTSIVVARALGPEVFGQLAMAQVLVLYLAALGDGGLTMWTQRQLVRRPHELSRLVAQTLAAQVVLALIAIGVIVTFAYTLPIPHGTSMLILAAAPFALTQALTMVYALQALERMRAAAAVKLVTQLVMTSVAITLVVLTNAAIWAVIAMWIGQLAGSILALALLVRHAHLRAVLPTTAGVRTTLLAGLPFLGSIALYYYPQIIDVIALGLLRDTYEVGIYNAAIRIMFVAQVIPLVVSTAVYPEMVRRHEEGEQRLGEFTGHTIQLALRVTIAIAVLTAALAPTIIGTLFGSSYADSAVVLGVLALLFPAYCYAVLAGHSLVAAGHQRRFLIGMTYSAGFATVCFPAAIIGSGALGAAVASVLTVLVQCAAFTVLSRGPLASSWGSLLGRESCFGLALVSSVTLVHVATAGERPILSAITCVVVALLIEAARGAPTVRSIRTGLTSREHSP